MMTPKLSNSHRWAKLSIHRSEGFAMFGTVMAAYVLFMIAATIITLSVYEIKKVGHWRKSNEAYFMARVAIAEAAYRLKADYQNVTADKYISESQPLFPEGDIGNRSFRYSVEPVGEVHFLGTQYMTGAFRVEALGTRSYRRRGLETRIERDTFLRYSRFVQQTGLAYASNANIMGDVYCGEDLSLNGSPITFWGDLEVGGSILNEWRGIFHGDVSGIGEGIDLVESVNISHYRDLARGFIPGEGTGLYLAGATSIDLDLFDFTGPVGRYDGNALPDDFNGVVFCEGDINIKGTLEGQSLTFFSADDIVATGHIRSGNTMTDSNRINPPMVFNSTQGVEQVMTRNLDDIITAESNVVKLRVAGTKWNEVKIVLMEDGEAIGETYVVREPGSPDEQAAIISNLELDPDEHTYSAEVHYRSSGNGANPTWIEAWEGDPINIGLVARDTFYIGPYTPRQLSIDAAILARDRNWIAQGNSSSHPNGFDSSVWELSMTGPIITMYGGSAGPWSSYGTRYYNFDMDMVGHAPPNFPVPADWWKLAYWWHLKDSEITL